MAKRKKPVLANRLLMALARGLYGKRYFTKKVKLVYDDTLSKIKPPFVVVANHCGFVDVGGMVMMLKNNCGSFVISVTQMAQWPGLIKQMGVLAKKQFTVDVNLIKEIKYVLGKGRPVIIYPEAKLSVVGKPNVIKPAVAKLIKLLKVPLVTVRFDGSYLHQPRWSKIKRFCPVNTTVKVAVTEEEIGKISVDEIHRRIVENLTFDDYQYQLDNKISIDIPDLAVGLENILYKCPECGAEYQMTSASNELVCSHCGAKVTMNEYGQLVGGKFSKVTDWYDWQAECARAELAAGNFEYRHDFVAEELVGKKYVPLGDARLTYKDGKIDIELPERTISYPRDAFYTLSFNNDYLFFPVEEGIVRLKRQSDPGCTTKLNVLVEQQSCLDEEGKL